MTPCFSVDRLRRLLADDPVGSEDAELCVHVDGCPACQSALEALFAAGDRPDDPNATRSVRPAAQDELAATTPRLTGSADGAPTPQFVLPDSFVGRLYNRLRAREPADGAGPPPRVPTVPGYEIGAELGRGGMGVVYRARQTSLGRDVALKMILGGEHASPQVRTRLQTEAELVARMAHPNIVQLYEVGEADGLPYLAMEFVDGGTLADRLGRRPPSPREAASVVATVAEAVHAAHCRNVVHRDLKPANVLLTAAGAPKIADFGLARSLDGGDRQTVSGQILGTPSFMSPEQASGRRADIGPATDVYALGGILYAALTGRVPFAADTPLATLMLVCHEEVVPPSRVSPRVPRDLDRICLKCLNKAPDRRYASGRELADDLNRYLRGEPVSARPVGAAVRVWKWTRRHPAGAALAALGLAALAGGLWYNGRLRGARAESAARAELARSAVDAMAPLAEEWLAAEPGQDPAQSAVLETALRVYETLAREAGDDPTLRRATALAQFRCGQIYRRTARTDEADRAIDRTIQLQQDLSREYPGEPVYRQDLANSYNDRGELARETRRPEEALEWYDRAVALQTELVSASDRAEYRKQLARSEYNRALALRQLGRPGEALDWLDRAAARLRPVAADNPGDPSYAQELARVYLSRAAVLGETQRVPEAVETCRSAIDVQRGLTARSPKPVYRYELAVSLFDLGNYLRAGGDPLNQAPAAYEESRAILAALVDRFPARRTYARQLATTSEAARGQR